MCLYLYHVTFHNAPLEIGSSVNLEKCPEYSRVFITLIEGAAIFMRICLIKIDRKFIRVLNLSLRMHFNPLVIPKSSHENKTNIFSKACFTFNV